MTTSGPALLGSEFALRYPQWQRQYLNALLELDPETLRERVAEAEAAIFKRLEALSESQSGQGERQAIEEALSALEVIKQNSLVQKVHTVHGGGNTLGDSGFDP